MNYLFKNIEEFKNAVLDKGYYTCPLCNPKNRLYKVIDTLIGINKLLMEDGILLEKRLLDCVEDQRVGLENLPGGLVKRVDSGRQEIIRIDALSQIIETIRVWRKSYD